MSNMVFIDGCEAYGETFWTKFNTKVYITYQTKVRAFTAKVWAYYFYAHLFDDRNGDGSRFNILELREHSNHWTLKHRTS